jgi:hypothetical protein
MRKILSSIANFRARRHQTNKQQKFRDDSFRSETTIALQRSSCFAFPFTLGISSPSYLVSSTSYSKRRSKKQTVSVEVGIRFRETVLTKKITIARSWASEKSLIANSCRLIPRSVATQVFVNTPFYRSHKSAPWDSSEHSWHAAQVLLISVRGWAQNEVCI